MLTTEVLIIGGGVVGAAIARELSRYQLDIILVEKNSDVATETSKANSGIIHAGYNASVETLKGRLNIKAVDKFDSLCQKLNVPFQRVGSLVVGFREEDLKKLRQKKENGEKHGIKQLEILDREELLALEPNLNKNVKYGLHAPTAGIVSPHELTIAYAENAALNGVNILLNTEVEDIVINNGKIKQVVTNREAIKARLVINAAGVCADKIARMGGEKLQITPRKGEYFLFDEEYGEMVNHVIFPMPTPTSKGILVTPTAHGNLMIGPNAREIENKKDKSTTREGLNEVYEGAKKLIPSLPGKGIIASFSGLRAAAEGEDFIIDFSSKLEGLLNVAGIQSPGLSSAPAIAEMVVGMVEEYFQKKNKNICLADDFQATLEQKPRFNDYRDKLEKWQKIIEEQEDYGEIVCRCELVTRGEILAAINNPLPARTLDAIKRRTRAGMGRCQGGFCGPRVVEILSEELGISPLEVTKRGGNSQVLKARAKELILQKKPKDQKQTGDKKSNKTNLKEKVGDKNAR